MLKTLSQKKFCAISYDNSTTLNDLKWYLNKLHSVDVEHISPEQFVASAPSREYQYINLVTGQEKRQSITEYMDQHGVDRFTLVVDSELVNMDLIGYGCFIYPAVTIYPSAVIENDVLIHGTTGISHNSKIGQGSFISGGVSISGSTRIGRHCWLAVTTVSLDHSELPDCSKTRVRSIIGNREKNK